MDGGAGDELPSFNEQGFDVLVDGDAQTRWLVEQLAIMDGANTPGVPANLHKCPGVAQAAATSLERAKSPIPRSEEHTSELQSLMRISYAVFCLKKKKKQKNNTITKKTHTHIIKH